MKFCFRLVCAQTAFAVLFILGSGQSANAQDHPNVIYILVDNWGWGDVSVQGSSIPTPRIDRLATEGTRFTNFNVQNQCTPTRSAIHTGGFLSGQERRESQRLVSRRVWLHGNTQLLSYSRIPAMRPPCS